MTYNPMNPYGDKLSGVKYFLVFNKNALPAPADAPFERDSAGYKQNAAATLKVSTAFRAASEKAAWNSIYPVGYAGLFGQGADEICVHKDDEATVKKLLNSLKADGTITGFREIPKEESFHYAMTKAKITLH